MAGSVENMAARRMTLITVQVAIDRVQRRRLWKTMPKHNKWRDRIELGMPADPRRQEFVGVERQCYRQIAARTFPYHAKAASASNSGSHFSMAASVILSWPLSMASMASELIMWKMFAVMPSVICSIRRSDFAVSTDG